MTVTEAARDQARYQRIAGDGRPRRRFSRRVLERFADTQPPDECQRCGVIANGSLELDHMMELVLGGPDHPHNLVRLCSRCHRAKPFVRLATLAECRLAVLLWVRDYPLDWQDIAA